MKVLKFGGTSVGSAANIRNVRSIINREEGKKIIVLSAMSGVTNHLVNLTELFKNGRLNEALLVATELKEKHFDLIADLIPSNPNEVGKQVLRLFDDLQNLLGEEYSEIAEARILTFGESVLTLIVSHYFNNNEVPNVLLEATKFMQVSNLENPDTDKVGRLLAQYLKSVPESDVYITQGFVRKDKFNRVSTLKRGGSDYTATILGAAVHASEIQIWTDIDGFHNNDPRYVENTHPLANLSFEEAAELAYFGAKILHPQTVSPVIEQHIPIYLKNTFTPGDPGTRISSKVTKRGLKAISAKDGITAIKIKSNRMLMAHGFLKKIFDVFDRHETSIDMITTSEIAISLTIDDTRNLNKILDELNAYGQITVEMDHSIICVVGEGLIQEKNTSRLFEILRDIPVRMISYGGSINNVSLLVATDNKVSALKALHEKLFSLVEEKF